MGCLRSIRAVAAVLAAAAFALGGCAVAVPPPKTAAAGPEAANAAWGAVLEHFVDDEGRIAFDRLAVDRGDLDRYVAYLAVTDPESSPSAFPRGEDVLAFYLNAYNALAMYNAIESGIPPELETIKVRFFYRDRLRLGGRSISLYALENSIIRPLGEPRVHFALNCMVRGCPRLPRKPFEGATLDADLEAGARLFFSEERYVRLDASRRTVFLSQILEWYEKDFLARARSLTAYVDRYRGEPIPADWRVAFIPYDWKLNSQ
jgi:hypothetical protein